MATKTSSPDMIAPPTPTPIMRNRNFKCDDSTWDEAAARAKRDGLTMSEVIRHYLREYGSRA